MNNLSHPKNKNTTEYARLSASQLVLIDLNFLAIIIISIDKRMGLQQPYVVQKVYYHYPQGYQTSTQSYKPGTKEKYQVNPPNPNNYSYEPTFEQEKKKFQQRQQEFSTQNNQRIPIPEHYMKNFNNSTSPPIYENTNIVQQVSPPIYVPPKPVYNESPQVQPSYGNEAVVYQNDPAVLNELEFLRNKLKECTDPKKMAEITKKLKTLFWEDLKKQEFKVVPGSVMFIGRTSSGKSSLLNALFDLKLKTSKATCTKEIESILQHNQITVYDCPGLDQYFDLVRNPERIPVYLGAVETIYYLYDGYIEDDILKTLSAMRKKFYMVRTKCDPDDNPSENESIRAKDIKDMKDYGYEVEVFLTSKMGGVDNQRLRDHILGKK